MILIVGNFLSQTRGTRQQCEEFAAALRKADYTVLTTSHYSNRITRMADMVLTVWRKRDQYSFAQVDVFSGNSFLWARAVCWILRLAEKPYILMLHGGNLPTFAAQRKNQVENLLKSATVVVTPSRYLLEHMKPYREDIFLIPNALQLANYDFHLREVPNPTLIWVRAFHQIYNPVLAVRVVAKLIPDFPQIKLIMVGPDKHDGSLDETHEVARDLGIFDHIEFPGAVSKFDIPRWLNKADIFINTTNVDNTPISVLEAMSCGLCIVSTNVGGIPYLLKDGEDALLVPPIDADAMARAIKRVLSEPGLASHLSQTSRAHSCDFDWAMILPQWEQIFQKAKLG